MLSANFDPSQIPLFLPLLKGDEWGIFWISSESLLAMLGHVEVDQE
jgi:hypothetical protein